MMEDDTDIDELLDESEAWIDTDAWKQKLYVHAMMILNSTLVLVSLSLLVNEEPVGEAFYIVFLAGIIIVWSIVEFIGTKLGRAEFNYMRFVTGSSFLALIIGVFFAVNDGTLIFGYASANQLLAYPINLVLYIITFAIMYHPDNLVHREGGVEPFLHSLRTEIFRLNSQS